LDCSLDRTAPLDLDGSDPTQVQATVFDFPACLCQREAIIAVTPTEARVAWFLPRFDPAEEGVKCKVYTSQHILQNLGAHLTKLGMFFLQGRKLVLLHAVGDADLADTVRLPPLIEGGIIEIT